MAAMLKIEKSQYLQIRLTDFAESFYDVTYFVIQSSPAVQK